MYGGNPNYKPGKKGSGPKVNVLPIEVFNNYTPRAPGKNPTKGKLISAFPVGEKRCRVRKGAYDSDNKLLYIILSEAKSEDIYASVQIYKLNGNTFEKVHEPLSAGRIGGLVVLGGGKVLVTLMQKDPKQISAMSLKPKWEAFKYSDKLGNAARINTDPIPQPGPNDNWSMAQAGANFYIVCSEYGKLHEYKKTGGDKCTREIKCMVLKNLEQMMFFPDNKTFVTVHRDKAYRWADRMTYHAFVHKMAGDSAQKLAKIDNVDQGCVAIFDMTKIIISRRKPLWDSLDFQVVDYKRPEELILIDSKLKLLRPMTMIGTERILVSLDDTTDTQFGLMQLSF